MLHIRTIWWLAVGVLQIISTQVADATPAPWSGSIGVDEAIVYDAPGGAPIGMLADGTAVTVLDWQRGPELTSDNFTWADIGGGRFLHSSVLRHSPLPLTPPSPPRLISTGHWADANLTQQVLTLFDGDTPVHLALMNSGRPGGAATETDIGVWPISRRVADETMHGDGYDISGVLFTQYFTDDGEAIHLNYWLADGERGIPRSHGCLGLAYADAQFAWEFLTVGSLVYVHA